MSKHDRNRRKIQKLIKSLGIDNFSEDHRLFGGFLLDPRNCIHLQIYFIICSGYMKVKDAKERLLEMISEMRFRVAGGYTYRDIFNMDPEWQEFFSENAFPHPSGQRRDRTDMRMGVDKKHVDEIMAIKIGPPSRCLQEAIVESCMAHLKEL